MQDFRFGIGCGVFWPQVGVVQYGSTVVHEFSLGEYETVEEVVEAARSINQRGGEETRTALGINVARYDTESPLRNNTPDTVTCPHTVCYFSLPCRSEAFLRGGRPGAQKVMIVITDGESHDSPQLVQAVGDSERDNITMYAIAVSPRILTFNPESLTYPDFLSGPGSTFLDSKIYILISQSSSFHPSSLALTEKTFC